MSYNQIIANIFQKAKQNGFLNLEQEINQIIEKGTTGSEITAMVGQYLLNIQTSNPELFLLIQDDVQLYIEQCKKQGLIISKN